MFPLCACIMHHELTSAGSCRPQIKCVLIREKFLRCEHPMSSGCAGSSRGIQAKS